MASKEGRTEAGAKIRRMRERYAAGDLAGARAEAWAVLHDEGASEAERGEAALLRDRTEVDRRAWAIGALALGIAVAVTIFFLL